MPTLQSFHSLIGINSNPFTKVQIFRLETELFIKICQGLKEFFRKQFKDYFSLMKFTKEMENSMIETKFFYLLIQEILATKEYNLKGIAYYTNTHVDVIEEIMIGKNTNPSAMLLYKLIDLHRTVRNDLYKEIIQKVKENYLADVA